MKHVVRWMGLPAVLLAFLSAMVMVPPPPASTSAAQTTPAAVSSPYRLPTLPPSPTPFCTNAQRNRLVVYERGRVSFDNPTPLNVREGPNTNFPILDSLPNGVIFFVLEGPVCSPRYAWYRIAYRDIEGWVAEGDNNEYFAVPYPPG